MLYLLYSPSGFCTAGIAVKIGGESCIIYARLHCLIADGEGLAEGMQWKGASALKPCFECENVVSVGCG